MRKYSPPRRIPNEYDQEIAKIAKKEEIPYTSAFRKYMKRLKGQWRDV